MIRPWLYPALLVLIVGMHLMPPLPSDAQSEPVAYEVISPQAVNARACARLDCAVVLVFEPGTVLTSTGSAYGDTVAGSDRWIQVESQGQTVFVHQSLLEQGDTVSASATVQEGTTDGDSPDGVVEANIDRAFRLNTLRWTEHEIPGLSFRAPSTWATCEELVDDDEYWEVFEDTFGKVVTQQQRQFIEECIQAQGDEFATAVVDPFGTGTAYVYIAGWSDVTLTPRYVQHQFELGLVDGLGVEIVLSELVGMPAGDVVHIDTSLGEGIYRAVSISYTVIDAENDTTYTVELTTNGPDEEYYAPFAEAIADSMRLIDNTKD